jgi:peptidoglycan hydrolase-like protein with peptidoglycan-binding domain
MKPFVFCLFAALLVGCQTAPPSAVLTPAKTSNTATRQSIKEARADIKFSQAKAAIGATSLEKADANLNQLLAAPQTAVSTPRNKREASLAPALRLTDKPNPGVKAVQEALIKLGYLQGPADGYAGPATNAALARAQSQ